MSYHSWPAYVPVAQRRAQAEKKIAKLKKQGKDIQPVNNVGRNIAKTFWGKGWCQHLEQFSDYSNRLPRGRTYVRNGSVCHLKIKNGKVEAIVSGSELYHINIKINPLTNKKWKKIQQQCSGQIGSMLELLQGKLSNSVMDVVTHPTEGLFPLSKEIKLDCDCPDWADMCKHIAAVLYGVGARLDESPELLFLLRGVDHHSLISHIDIDLTQSKRPKLKGDLGNIFGIELDKTNSQKPKTAKRKSGGKKTASKKAISKKAVPTKNTSKPGKPKTRKSITRLRKHLGMSYTQFAKLVGVNCATVSNWERKTGQLNLKNQNNEALTAIENLTKQQAWEQLATK